MQCIFFKNLLALYVILLLDLEMNAKLDEVI